MVLTKPTLERTHRALLASFSREELLQLVHIGLGENFEALVPSGNLSAQVLELLRWAERHNRAVELLECLAEERPGNAELSAILASLRSDQKSAVAPIPTYPYSNSLIAMQKPPRAQHFVGREKELLKLLADLQPRKVVTLCGPGGMGKSALAAEIVWRLAPGDDPPEQFPDGIIFHTFYHQPQADLALESIARAFRIDPLPTPRAAAKQALVNRQALLVLDGAEAADDLEAVLLVAASCGVLITTRRHQDAPDQWDDIKPLEQDSSVALLRAWAHGRADDDAAASELSALLGGLPLALFLVGRYLAQRNQHASEYVDWLKQLGLEALHFSSHSSRSIPRLMERSLEQVSERARAAYLVAGILALAPFDVRLIAPALDVSPAAAHQGLGELVDYGLLLRPADEYVVTHALAHAYAHSQPTPKETLARLAAACIMLAEQANRQGRPGLALLDHQIAHFIAVQAAALDAELWGEVIQIAWSLKGYLERKGYASDQATVGKAGLAAARALGSRMNEGSFLSVIGSACAALGQTHQAVEFHEQHLLIAQALGAKGEEGIALGNLGNVYVTIGELTAAIQFHEQHLAITREIGDRSSEGAALSNLGYAYANIGQIRRAITLYTEALDIARQVGDRRVEVQALSNLGASYAGFGDTNSAIEMHEQCLQIARELGDRRDEATAIGNLGKAYMYLGDARQSIALYEQKLAIIREIGYRRGEGAALGNIGFAYAALGDIPRAMELYRQRLAIAREVGDRRGEGYCYGDMGNAYTSLGDLPKAVEYFERQLSLISDIGYRRGEGTALGNLGLAYLAAGEPKRACALIEQQISIMQEVRNRRGEGAALGNLGRARAQIGDTDSAISCCQKSLEIRSSAGDRIGEGEALGHLGYAYFAAGEHAQACVYLLQSVALLREVFIPELLCSALTDLAETQLALRDLDSALEHVEHARRLAEEHRYRLRNAAALWCAARILAQQAKHDDAVTCALEAVEYYGTMNERRAKEIRYWLEQLPSHEMNG